MAWKPGGLGFNTAKTLCQVKQCQSNGTAIACYKVKLDNGLFKEAVPEDEISGEVTSDMGDLFGGWG